LSYQPLATKYRPSRFEELVGQDSVAKALANAIRLGREPHGVIFSGVRGIGKTTTARLYAKALNCDNGPTPEPCNECDSCKAITKGSHEDVLEIDGASNTGVGDVRELQETVEYSPQRSKYKVYIIDEVHMLSQAAFNALLKTLEEPPSHVVFVFATTELAKVPQTIVSRCQTFYLQKLSLRTIRARLVEILDSEEVEYEDQALTIVAKEGHGSMRDALTSLDQAIAIGEGRVTVEALAGIVSNLSTTPFLSMLDALIERNGKACHEIARQWDQDGAEFEDIAERLAMMARHAFVIRDLGVDALDVGLLGLDDEEVTCLKDIANKAEAFDLNRLFRTLVKSRSDMRGEIMDRFIFENYLLEWCFDPGLPDLKALINGDGQIQKLQTRSNANATQTHATPSTSSAAQGSPQASASSKFRDLRAEMQSAAPKKQATASPEPVSKLESGQQNAAQASEAEPGFPDTWRELVNHWKRKKPLQARKLEEVRPIGYSEQHIELTVDPDSFASKSLLSDSEHKMLSQEFKKLFGFVGKLEIRAEKHDNIQDEPEKIAGPVETAISPEPAPPVDPVEPLETELPETILETKTRENEIRDERIKNAAIEAPLTQEVLSVLGGSVKDVKVRERGLTPEA
jgi:DNA polymerase-3 subunit gamma/tau